MKNLSFLIAGILIIIWIIAVIGFNPFGVIHFLLVLAGFSIIIGIFLNKKLSRK